MFSRAHRVVVCLLVVAFAMAALAQNHPPQSKRGFRRPTISKGSPARPLTGPTGGRPSDVALQYIRDHGDTAGLAPEDVADIRITAETRSPRSGIAHVYVRQRVRGLEIFGADSNFNIRGDGALVGFGTSFLPGVNESTNRTSPALGAVAAATAALADVGLTPAEPLTIVEVRGGPEQESVLTTGGVASTPIIAKLVYQPVELHDLRLAWQVDIDESSGQHLWRMTVDAETGEVLTQEDYVLEDNWDLSEGAATELFVAEESEEGTVAPLASPTPVFDGSSYRVLAIPKESPNDGPQTVVQTPADATASPFGWHDTDQAAGPEFTITRGNNAHAYLDQDASNGADAGADAEGGAGLDFDFAADLAEHSQNYREAVVTNLFYWNNLFHDVLYRYGFDEASGNFQANNYGRGGTGGDYVRAEAADGSGLNNANFSTPVETSTSAGTPRMQMYLWPGDQFGPQNEVVVDGLGSYAASWARFSPAPTVAGTSGAIINAGTGCAVADYASAPPAGNWIAIVTGNNTGCQNVDKARRAAEAGAKALIVANTSSSRPVLTGSLATPGPAIPVASINLADGDAIRAAIAAGAVTGTVRKDPDHPGIRDGDFENGIIVHEYGHGVSLRLTGGPAVNCLSGDEQGGEGWSDYFAMVMTLNPAVDDPDGQRGMGPYALFQNSRQGAGIRPRPYSRTMEVQPFTYDSIKSGGWLNGGTLAVPHGVGHGWAAILWDMTWDLIDKHGFNPDLYAAWNTGGNNRALQYVIDGLKMQGCSPGFVAARDAIIAAAEALDPGDACTLWASFARRGLGYSAVQGTTSRGDNTEAFDTHPACRATYLDNVLPAPAINVVKVGSTVPLNFSVPGATVPDILAENSPYSRQVECTSLRTIDPNATFITPRPYPVPMQSPGASALQYDPRTGRYTFPWKTDPAWAGTCREAVLTRNDGVQHRAFFFFDSQPSHPVSGYVRDSSGQPVPNATVRITGSPYGAVVTDGAGYYRFPSVATGTYTATAAPSGAGCVVAQSREFTVSRPTTVDFTLPTRVDAFGYSCRNETAGFEEAATIEPITGTSGVGAVSLPFPVVFYGQSYDQVYVCANGFVEFATAGMTTNCSSTNGTIPGTARPNGAIYPFWDDLVVDASSSIRTELKGAAPNRRFVIEFRNVHVSGNTSQRLDFNAILLENGQVVMQHRNIANDPREQGSSATIGIEMHTGTVALMYSLNTPALAVEPAVTTIRYLPPPLYTVSGIVRDTDGTAEGNATVTLETAAFTLTAVTGTDGRYAFPGVPAGTYTATAAAGRCKGHVQTLAVSGNVTLDFLLGELPDAFGYRCGAESAAFEDAANVEPITGTSGVGAVALPFPFTFYGQTYDQVYVCANGFVEFATAGMTTNCSSSNGTIPGTGRPNGAIYPFWDDLVVDASSSIRTEVKGAAPARRFVIEFRNVYISGNTAQRLDFNAVLLEDGRILTQYRNIANDVRERGSSATMGIENQSGTVALMYSLNTPILPVEPAVTTIRYVPPPLYAVSGLVRDGSGNPAPNVTVTLTRAPLVLTTTTDATGHYAFPSAPGGAYTAVARAGGCSGHTQSVTVAGDTTLDFALGDIADAFGNRCRLENQTFEEAATIVPISGDDLEPVAGSIELPFPFTFYGQTYADAYVCTNGFLEFAGPSTANCAFTNTALPNANRPNGTIYALWDDVVVDASASIRTETKGVSPSRRFVVEYRNVRFISGTQRLDFNIVLFEDGRVMTQYRNIADDGRERGNSATIGIEDHTGTDALQFSLNEVVLGLQPAVTSIVYRPPGMP